MINFAREVFIQEKKSKFLGFLLNCSSVQEINSALAYLKTEHKKATHICYAYSLKSPFIEKACDDGEPSGTAGRPILNVIQKQGRKDVCVFIVRYFGGVKLGAGGLVRIYTKTTSELFKETS